MAVNSLVCLLVLIFLTGISGAEGTHVFSSSSENVRLPCDNDLSDCTSTTWIYSKDSQTVELVTEGIKRKNTERHERLSLGSDCSLNIKKVTKEDHGLYSCRQYVNGQQQGADALVHLHVLHVSSSSSQSEISPGRSVTLYCQLDRDHRVSCDTLVRTDGVQLMWVNPSGVNLMTDSRYQILFSSDHCMITLTTTLLNEDHNRQWRCQITQRNQIKTSVTYTVRSSVSTTTTLNSPVTTTNSQGADDNTTIHPEVWGTVVAALALLLIAVIVFVILKRRAGNKRQANDSVVTDKNTLTKTNDPINISMYPVHSAKEQNDEVTYTEIATYSNLQANKGHEDDKVTFSSTREGKAEPLDDCSHLYATVNKNRQTVIQ